MRIAIIFCTGVAFGFVFQEKLMDSKSVIAKTSKDALQKFELSNGVFPDGIDHKAGFDIRLKHNDKELRIEGMRICKGISVACITDEELIKSLTEPEDRITEPMRSLLLAWLDYKLGAASTAILENNPRIIESRYTNEKK